MKRFAFRRSIESEPGASVHADAGPGHSAVAEGEDREARAQLAIEAAALRSKGDGLLQQVREYAQTLDGTIAKRTSEIARLEAKAEEAAQGRKIRALGMIPGLRVVLYEDRIETPDGIFPLTADVHARSDTQGMKQSVQGWVFKSDQDRREIYLHINGPEWHSLQRYDMKYSLKQPQSIMEMAYAIGDAAAACDEARTAIRARATAAFEQLLEYLVEAVPEDEVADSLTSLESTIAGLVAKIEDAERRAGDLSVNPLNRPLRNLASARSRLDQANEQRVEVLRRWAAAKTGWRDRAEVVKRRMDDEARKDEPAVASWRLNAADPATALVPAAPIPDMTTAQNAEEILALIERLGELRAKGLVSDEEFSSKKDELLGRL